MIHLKHVSVATSEGYYGRPGSSAAAFLAEVERERATARIEATTELCAGWVAGEPATGPGRGELQSLFAAVHAEMAKYWRVPSSALQPRMKTWYSRT